MGIYQPSFFDDNIQTSLEVSGTDLPVPADDYSIAVADSSRYEFTDFRISVFYVSDIHLDQKLSSRYPERCNEGEVRHFCADIVRNFKNDFKDYRHYDPYIVIAGDLSSNLNICRIFFEELTSLFNPFRIIYILGNHELWATHRRTVSSYEQVVEEYRMMALSLRITFLENEVLLLKNKRQIYALDDLMEASDDDILHEVDDASLIVLGGIGFAGLNPKYNASLGMYMDTVRDRFTEVCYSSRFESLYLRLRSLIWHRPVLVVTHMPKQDWSSTDYCPSWFYISGHTHSNQLLVDESCKVYSDNQIGYRDSPVHLKMFDMLRSYDFFVDRGDGIYSISPQEYRRFNSCMGIAVNYGRDKEVIMLKRSGLYMFLLESSKGKISLLNGGALKHLDYNDVEYYYQNMERYALNIRSCLSGYFDSLGAISKEVRSFGGTGTVHGCIVDIDFFNHLYVNIYDGKVTPYHASSIVNKIVYPSLEKLLRENCPGLLKRYLSRTSSESSIVVAKSSRGSKPMHYDDTSIYKPSRAIRGFQYLMECRVIRNWDYDILDMDSITLPKLMAAMLDEGGSE